MSKDKAVHNFNIIRVGGVAREAVTVESNKKIYRQDKLFIPEFGRFVVCAPYDNHFIYESPTNRRGSAFMCTCGAAAIIVGHDAYKKDASATSGLGIVPGELLICNHHSHYGSHADGSS